MANKDDESTDDSKPTKRRRLYETVAEMPPGGPVFAPTPPVNDTAVVPPTPVRAAPAPAMVLPPPPAATPSPAGTRQADESRAAIRHHALWAAGLGMVPVPIFDMAAITAIQVRLARRLSAIYGLPFSNQVAKSVVAGLIAGGGSQLSALVVSRYVKWVPGIGQLLGAASFPAAASALTYGMGRVLARHFEKGGRLEDLDLDHGRAALRREVRSGT